MMRFKSFSVDFISLVFVLAILASLLLVSSTAASPDNVAPGTPEVVAIQADDNLVNTWGDNVTITFQVYDENGINDIKSVEVWIKNGVGGTENYDNWPGGNIKVRKISPYENEYSFTFNPENSFKIGSATVKVRATDNAGLENTQTVQDMFQVTDADISVTTENADNITKNSATLHASIDLGGHDKIEARFYYENETDHSTWENLTNWENVSIAEYERTVDNLESYEVYEFMASIQLPGNNPDSASQSDNGSVLKFDTFPENAQVTTKSATDIEKGDATLHASIDYGGYDNVDVVFYYRKEEGTWQNTGWKENYTLENYSKKLSGLASGTVYEFYPEIRFGPPSDNIFDNGSIFTFNSGGVEILTSHELEVEVDSEVDITIEVRNEHQDKELRNVVVEAQGDRYSDDSVTIDTIPADASDLATFTYDPESSGEKNLQFSVFYRVYQDNEFLFSKSREIETSILVTGTEYENAIDLRISDENPPLEWIFNGETFKVQIEVHNQRSAEVTGVRITSEKARDYGVGTLGADESMTVQIQVSPENYEVGTNEVTLRAIHERGVSPPLTIKFGVRPESAPVEVFLLDINSPIYEGQNLDFTLLVAGSTDSEAKDLVVEALSDNVIPTGYWVGEEMKNPPEEELTGEMQMEDLLTYLGVTQPTGAGTEEEEERAVIGRKLYFEAKNLSRGDNALKFQVTYVLGENVITREFEVDFEVRGTPGIMLIQRKPVTATRGESVVVSLEIANEMSVDVESVYVIPPENVEITPTARWVGDMEAGAYLPVDFQLQTQDLQDGDNLTFYAVYRIGNETHRSQPLVVTVKLTEPEESSTPHYLVASVVLVAVLLLVYYWRRR